MMTPHGSSAHGGLWLASLVAPLILFTLAVHPSHAMEHCTDPITGAPSCSSSVDPGSARTPQDVGVHVGNPIEVISGNKYQRETDYRAAASALAWTRHYNSALVHRDVGLGPGWTSSWHVDAFLYADGRLGIRQSDGRALAFTPISGTDSPTVFKAEHASDGVAIRAPQLHWYLGDGREIRFEGTRPVEFESAAGDVVDVSYADGRITRVQDHMGRSLVLDYVTSDDPLPRFGGDERHKPLGAIEAITLPNGEQVRYAYGADRELVDVTRSRGEVVEYGYEDQDWPLHLTRRQSTMKEGASHWQYDEWGRAISWQSATEWSLSIDRTVTGNANAPAATVTYSDGRVVAVREGNTASSHAARDKQTSRPSSDPALQTFEQSIQDTLTPIPGSHDLEAVASLADQTFPVKFEFDARGKWTDAELGELVLSDAVAGYAAGDLVACSASTNNQAETGVTRLSELANGAPPCARDTVMFYAVMEGVVDQIDPRQTIMRIIETPDIDYDNHGCDHPHGDSNPQVLDCDELTDHYQMAEYSRCAYDVSVCPYQGQRVDPASIGMSESDFHNEGFDAELFYDSATDTYILSFRGTDEVLADWGSNIPQGRGDEARQYLLAQQLAIDLRAALPNANIAVTGHSLGGGLASHAGLILGSETTVFNPAALHPNTAAGAGTDARYADAEQYIDVVRVEGDPVSGANRFVVGIIDGAQEAPGNHTVLDSPPDSWLQAHPDRGLFFPDSLLRHSMSGVLEALRIALDTHCGITV